MKTFHSKWRRADGLQIYSQGWEPDAEIRAAICLVHGLGEHSGRYQHVAQRLTDAGFAMLAFDLYGHGQSQGKRGHAPGMQVFLEDIDRLIQEARTRWPDAPVFLYGHSLGGGLVLYYSLQRQPALNGVISTSPPLRTSLEQQKLKIALARVMGAVAPEFSLPSGLLAKDLSRDPQVIGAYLADPLVHDRATLAMANSSFAALQWTSAHASQFSLPLLLMHGDQDAICYASGSQDFAAQVNGDCTFKLWPGLLHETHNEPEKAEVLDFMVAWINRKL